MLKHTYEHLLVLPNRRLVRLAADDYFFMLKRTYVHVLVLPSQPVLGLAARRVYKFVFFKLHKILSATLNRW